MRVKIVALLFVLCTFTTFSFSQDKSKEEKLPIDLETVSLPDTPNSWIINIHQRGGFIGIHKLLVTLNSEGKYACSENGKARKLDPKDKNFLALSKLVEPVTYSILLKPINEDFSNCMDCLYTTFSLRRQKNDTKDGEITLASAKQIPIYDVKEISKKLWETVKCD